MAREWAHLERKGRFQSEFLGVTELYANLEAVRHANSWAVLHVACSHGSGPSAAGDAQECVRAPHRR
jgi:hypothetical protein